MSLTASHTYRPSNFCSTCRVSAKRITASTVMAVKQTRLSTVADVAGRCSEVIPGSTVAAVERRRALWRRWLDIDTATRDRDQSPHRSLSLRSTRQSRTAAASPTGTGNELSIVLPVRVGRLRWGWRPVFRALVPRSRDSWEGAWPVGASSRPARADWVRTDDKDDDSSSALSPSAALAAAVRTSWSLASCSLL